MNMDLSKFNDKKYHIIIVIAVIVFLIIFAGGAYLRVKNKKETAPTPQKPGLIILSQKSQEELIRKMTASSSEFNVSKKEKEEIKQSTAASSNSSLSEEELKKIIEATSVKP